MIHRLATTFGRLYPLKSGCGPVANSALFRWLDQPGGPDGVARVVGGRAVVPAGDYVGRAMRFVGDLDPKVSWVVDQVLRPGDTALDIGSNLGLVSLRMAARVGPNGAVHAFDPQPRMQAYLRKTMELNPKLPITLHPIGLGSCSETLRLNIPSHNAGAASLVADVGTTHPISETVDVSVEPLDNYAKAVGIKNVRMIKMDVEGFEAQVLIGASEFLEANKPAVILLEDNARDATSGQSSALRTLQDLGYAIYTLPRALFSVRLGKISNGEPAHDFVAVSPQASTELYQKLRIS